MNEPAYDRSPPSPDGEFKFHEKPQSPNTRDSDALPVTSALAHDAVSTVSRSPTALVTANKVDRRGLPRSERAR